jgi:endoglucanase
MTAPYTVDPEFMKRVHMWINMALNQSLIVFLDFHDFKEFFNDPDNYEEMFLSIWRQVAPQFSNYSDNLMIELLNEPQKNLNRARWNRALNKAIPIIRQTNPNRTLIVSSAEYGSIFSLDSLILPEDDQNIIVTVHYYDPVIFTHQGAWWLEPELQTKGIPWPGPPANYVQPISAALNVTWSREWFDKFNNQNAVGDLNVASEKTIRDHFDRLIIWSWANNRPANLGEFGTIYFADLESRKRWAAAVKRQAVRANISFMYWEVQGLFYANDPSTGLWTGIENEVLS